MPVSPIDVLKDAIRAVPAVRYALGVAGVVAVIAIVKAFGIDFRVAVFGFIVILALMVALVLFARLTRAAGNEWVTLPVKVLTWSLLLLTIAAAILFFTSVFFDRPLDMRKPVVAADNGDGYTPEESRVIGLKQDIVALRGKYESITDYPAARAAVNQEAPRLSDLILGVDDKGLDLARRILKYEYGCYGFMMAASTDTGDATKSRFADSAIAGCTRAKDLMSEAEKRYSNDKNARETVDWMKGDETEPRLDYLLAMNLCIKARIEHDPALRAKAVEIINAIPSYYTGRFPPQRTADLTYCVQGGDQ
jgi:hypothetical protein